MENHDDMLAAARRLEQYAAAHMTRTKRQAPGFSPGSSVQAGTACCCSMY